MIFWLVCGLSILWIALSLPVALVVRRWVRRRGRRKVGMTTRMELTFGITREG